MDIRRSLEQRVEAALGAGVTESRVLGGGDVSEAYRMVLDDDRMVFAKTHRRPPPGFFATEAASLAWLGDSGAVRVPRVLAVDDTSLVLEWVAEGGRATGAASEAVFGAELAALHAAGAPCFGRVDRATTTSRSLPNDPTDSWAEFFATNRLLPLARLAADASALSEATIRAIEALAAQLDLLGVPVEAPARLHGDLWAGNRLVDADGHSWLIDPAAYGGHREFDLAMMDLFGGFGPECWAGYEEVAPLADGWRVRVPLHQLAPLITHAIKFGGAYVAATDRAVASAARLG